MAKNALDETSKLSFETRDAAQWQMLAQHCETPALKKKKGKAKTRCQETVPPEAESQRPCTVPHRKLFDKDPKPTKYLCHGYCCQGPVLSQKPGTETPSATACFIVNTAVWPHRVTSAILLAHPPQPSSNKISFCFQNC